MKTCSRLRALGDHCIHTHTHGRSHKTVNPGNNESAHSPAHTHTHTHGTYARVSHAGPSNTFWKPSASSKQRSTLARATVRGILPRNRHVSSGSLLRRSTTQPSAVHCATHSHSHTHTHTQPHTHLEIIGGAPGAGAGVCASTTLYDASTASMPPSAAASLSSRAAAALASDRRQATRSARITGS